MIELDSASDCDRIDELAGEFVERLRRGESPSISEFADRCPGSAEEVRALLASVLLIEQWKQQKAQERSGWHGTAVPEHLGDYRVLRELGRGGMGLVYEAEQMSLGRRVALKVLPQHSLLDPNRLKRFQREAQTAARLHHTNIVQVFGVGEHEGLHYIVMQRIEGRGLDQVLDDWKDDAPEWPEEPSDRPAGPAANRDRPARRGDPRHWRRIARIGVQAAEALQYAHNQGVLHRDIKPANLLLDDHDVVWVTDFGLAKLSEEENLSSTGDLIGTLQYIAPERFESQADARSDIYSLGLTLYELLTLEAAFPQASSSKLIQSVSAGRPERPGKRNPAIPRDLETIVLKSIAREPEHRYATAGELAEDLKRFLDDQPVWARRTSAIERLARWCRRNRAVTALSAAALGLLLLVAVVGWAGYVSTTRALDRESIRRAEAEIATRRVEDNVALSIEAIETLFQQLAMQDLAPPSYPWGGPGNPTKPGSPYRPASGASSEGPRSKSVYSTTNGIVWGARASLSDAEMLKGVLQFYDRFAAINTTNLRLKREAAMAHRRVGDIQRQLGHEDQAREAYRRAAVLFETLLASEPGSAELRYKLADTYAASVSASLDPVLLMSEIQSLLRAEALAQDVVGMDRGPSERAGLLSRILVQLGERLDPLGRTKEAETYLRRGVALQKAINERGSPMPHFTRLPMTTARQALANFLGSRGDQRQALALLNECCAELDAAVATDTHPGLNSKFLSLRYESLSSSLARLGEKARADEVAARARRLRRPRSIGVPRGVGRESARGPVPPLVEKPRNQSQGSRDLTPNPVALERSAASGDRILEVP